VPVVWEEPGNWYAPHPTVSKTSPPSSAFRINTPNAGARFWER
jgi:hypothetical protein